MEVSYVQVQHYRILDILNAFKLESSILSSIPEAALDISSFYLHQIRNYFLVFWQFGFTEKP